MPRSRRLLARLGDDRLVEQVRRGNDAAFVVIYERHGPGLLSFCRHMLGSREEAEDALQQTLVSAFGALRSHERPITLRPWLYTIARNRCLSILRGRREPPSGEAARVSAAGLSEEVERRIELRELLGDLARLPVRQREALVLSELGDLGHAEIAEVIGCETKHVKALVFQARSALAQSRRAREIPCAEIQEELASAAGGALRRAPLRRHLQTCAACAEFRDEVRRQRQLLAVVVPAVPSLGLKESVLAAADVGIGIGGGGAAAGGGGLLAGLGSHGAAKVTTLVLATGGAVGGVAATDPQLFTGKARGSESQGSAAEGAFARDLTDADDSFDWDSATRAAKAAARRGGGARGPEEASASAREGAGGTASAGRPAPSGAAPDTGGSSGRGRSPGASTSSGAAGDSGAGAGRHGSRGHGESSGRAGSPGRANEGNGKSRESGDAGSVSAHGGNASRAPDRRSDAAIGEPPFDAVPIPRPKRPGGEPG